MTRHMLSRWPVVQEILLGKGDVAADGSLDPRMVDRWLDIARDAYIRECRPLSSAVASGIFTLRSIGDRRRVSATFEGDAVLVAASVTEVRQSSFDMAVRVRSCADGDVVLDSVITFGLAKPMGNETLAIPPDVHAALIAMEKSAREYC